MDPGARSTDPSFYHAWPRRAGRFCAWSSRCLFPVAVQPCRCSAAVEGIGPGALSTLLPRLRGQAACRRRLATSILKRSSPLSGSRWFRADPNSLPLSCFLICSINFADLMVQRQVISIPPLNFFLFSIWFHRITCKSREIPHFLIWSVKESMDLLVLTCFPYAGRIPCLLLR